ncbi:MAG: hypothetical protein LBV74_17260 [Tannerella sp.]|jgi:hypothetical protein|nr:hypothetical protein [Tannerella sp.]
MKKFDLNDFKDLPLANWCSPTDDHRVYMTDTKKISVTISHKSADIVVTREDMNTPYGSMEIYALKTKILIREGKQFSTMPVGIWTDYDENGKLIKETDYDSRFLFSVDSLIVKMKKEYDVDILDKENTWVQRYAVNQDPNKPVYRVTSRLYQYSENYNIFIIEGNTGDLIFRGIQYAGDKKGLLEQYDLYMKSLNKQE